MKLNYQGLQDKQSWEKIGVTLPKYDWRKVCDETEKNPVWVHFGAGNIFRGFIAGLQSRLLDDGLTDKGIIAAETFDYEIIDKIYYPHDSMTLMVSLKPDGNTDKSIIASITQGVKANEREKLRKIFTNPSLQIISCMITEKGYALRDMNGDLLNVVKSDIESGPENPNHAMRALQPHFYIHDSRPVLSLLQSLAWTIAVTTEKN